jgi:hypothetical protein
MSDPVTAMYVLTAATAVNSKYQANIAPGTPTPKVAPTPDSGILKAAASRAYQRKYASQGRASTLLSNQDTLG